jgi:hypothetical protein
MNNIYNRWDYTRINHGSRFLFTVAGIFVRREKSIYHAAALSSPVEDLAMEVNMESADRLTMLIR